MDAGSNLLVVPIAGLLFGNMASLEASGFRLKDSPDAVRMAVPEKIRFHPSEIHFPLWYSVAPSIFKVNSWIVGPS